MQLKRRSTEVGKEKEKWGDINTRGEGGLDCQKRGRGTKIADEVDRREFPNVVREPAPVHHSFPT